VAHVEQARGLVGAFEVASGLEEAPALVAHGGGVGDALEQQGAVADFLEKIAGAAAPQIARGHGVEKQVDAVELFPVFGGELVAHGARVFAGLIDGGDDGVGVFRLENEELGHAAAGGLRVELGKQLLVTGALHDRLPVAGEGTVVEVAEIEQELEVYIDEARRVFGAFDVAAHPVEAVGDATEHGYWSPESTQVSLLPPPWEELTTSEPLRRATRVSPPGMMTGFSP
jgi:hypothetical protein